jgi:hypothetical protein
MRDHDRSPAILVLQAVIDVVRPGIEAALAGRASCTTALSGMLEVSKKLCFILGGGPGRWRGVDQRF